MGGDRPVAAFLTEADINYYPFHIGDYVSATRHLSWEEDAAYRRLLDTYYTTEKPLPADLRQVCRLVLATTDSQREAVEIVLGEFFQLTETGWVSERAEREIAAMQDKQQKQRAKANKRWHKPDEEHGNAPAMPRHQESDAAASKNDADAMPPTPTPTPINTTAKAVVGAKRRKPQLGLPDDFAPNEVGLAKAAEKHLDVQAEMAKFRNYHEAKGSVMADWQAAWRTWVGNARPGTTGAAGGSGPKRGTDEYFALHRNASWVRAAGFGSVWDAANAKCWHDNAHHFRDGKRVQEVAA